MPARSPPEAPVSRLGPFDFHEPPDPEWFRARVTAAGADAAGRPVYSLEEVIPTRDGTRLETFAAPIRCDHTKGQPAYELNDAAVPVGTYVLARIRRHVAPGAGATAVRVFEFAAFAPPASGSGAGLSEVRPGRVVSRDGDGVYTVEPVRWAGGGWVADGHPVAPVYRLPTEDTVPPPVPAGEGVVYGVDDGGQFWMTPWGGQLKYAKTEIVDVSCGTLDDGTPAILILERYIYRAARDQCEWPQEG